jgi:hypothetical protein
MSSQGVFDTTSQARFQWQCKVGWGNSWTDYEEAENMVLETAWTRQLWSEEELAITLIGWPDHVIYLGVRLQQANFTTGKTRTIRRVQIIEQGQPGGWCPRILTESGEEGSATSEDW